MSIAHLGFRDLKYIVTVAETESFTAAAEACAITQPALSERIKRIEQMLDVPLFERTKRAVRVTAVGERVIAKAQELLDEMASIDDIVSQSRAPLTGALRIGIIATLGQYLMPLILPLLTERYPDLVLTIQEGLTESLLATLQAGSLDMVLAAAPIHGPGLVTSDLFYEPFVLAIPAAHSFAKKPKIMPGDLRGDEMVLLEDGHCLAGQALDVCPARQRRNRDRLHAMSPETLRHMVAAGAGYSLLPWLAVGSNPPMTDLVRYRSLDGKRKYGRQIIAAYRASYGRPADIDHLAALIREALPQGFGNTINQ